MPERNIKTKDKNMAERDVEYVTIYNDVRFPKVAWDAWSKDQQKAYIDELKRQELSHQEE